MTNGLVWLQIWKSLLSVLGTYEWKCWNSLQYADWLVKLYECGPALHWWQNFFVIHFSTLRVKKGGSKGRYPKTLHLCLTWPACLSPLQLRVQIHGISIWDVSWPDWKIFSGHSGFPIQSDHRNTSICTNNRYSLIICYNLYFDLCNKIKVQCLSEVGICYAFNPLHGSVTQQFQHMSLHSPGWMNVLSVLVLLFSLHSP